MKNYYNVSLSTGRPTGVKGYDYDNTSMTVYFTNGNVYVYTLESCGEVHLNTMKRLADANSGLNTYLTKNKPPFAFKH